MTRPRSSRPIPMTLRLRTFPAAKPKLVRSVEPFPERVIVADVALGPEGRAVAGGYIGDGPDLTDVRGRFTGADISEPVDVARGPVRDGHGFLDHVIWRPLHTSRFGFVAWDPAAFFSSLAHSFTTVGNDVWARVFTDPNPTGGRWVDYERCPIVLSPRSDGRIAVSFGPRKHPELRDFDEDGRRYTGRFACLRDIASALVGERVEDLNTACRLFDVNPPPPGPATVDALDVRIAALRELYTAVRRESELWP